MGEGGGLAVYQHLLHQASVGGARRRQNFKHTRSLCSAHYLREPSPAGTFQHRPVPLTLLLVESF